MQINRKVICFAIVLAIGVVSCNTKCSSGDGITKTHKQAIIEQMFSGNELMTDDLATLKIIDTAAMVPLRETGYCDTTLKLNDSVSYSIISLADKAGLCTHFIVISLDTKKWEFIASKFLHPDCDVDYSGETYQINKHRIVSKDKIEVIQTTVVQKEDRASANEEENITEKQQEKRIITISEDGGITFSEAEMITE